MIIITILVIFWLLYGINSIIKQIGEWLRTLAEQLPYMLAFTALVVFGIILLAGTDCRWFVRFLGLCMIISDFLVPNMSGGWKALLNLVLLISSFGFLGYSLFGNPPQGNMGNTLVDSHHRDGTWVRPHVRGDSLVRGHWRRGTWVKDHWRRYFK